MATLCTKCLTALRSGSRVCSKCGTEQHPTLEPTIRETTPGGSASKRSTSTRSLGWSADLEPKWDPPAFQLTAFEAFPVEQVPAIQKVPTPEIDPTSPQSLLGPSSYAAPKSAVPSPDALPHPLTDDSAADHSAAATGSAPTAQDLLFGSLLGKPASQSSPPTPATSPAPATMPTPPTPHAPVSAPTPVSSVTPASAVTANSEAPHQEAGNRFAKLTKPQLLVPIAGLLVVAVVASVMAVGGSTTPRQSALANSHSKTKTTTATGSTGHVSTKSLSFGTPTGSAMSIPLRSTGNDPRPEITVRIGNDAPIHVILDTGSVGLRVFSDVVPTGTGKGIQVTNQSDSVEYVDGTQFGGSVAKAVVHIGTLSTSTLVPFQLVQSVTCDPAAPDCPASGGADQFQADGVDGVMGIGLSGAYPGDPATNPLLALPSPYRNSWSISMAGGGQTLPASGTLVLGAKDPSAPAADFALQPYAASVHGMPTWNDQFNLCWNVGGISSCELSVFDSGSDLTVLGGTAFANVSTDNPGEVGMLTTGTSVQASQEVDSNPLWSFTSGGGAMQTVVVEPSGNDWVNSGVQAFYSFTVTYDEVHGEIFLS
jgi:Protein of unknown function (DUF3443)